jgi:hypothetical protein
MGVFKDRTGQVFGRLEVLSQLPNRYGKTRWLCRCECGTEKEVSSGNLVTGEVTSCGCYSRELLTTHGQYKSPTYSVWRDMIQRTSNPNCKASKNYLHRGITVCDSWRVFESFLADMGDKPEGLTLDRVNNDGNYCKDNCRWATPIQQHNNKRSNVFIEFNGERQTVTQWARQLGMSKGTLRGRLNSVNWGTEKALTQPLTNCGKRASKAFQDKLMG